MDQGDDYSSQLKHVVATKQPPRLDYRPGVVKPHGATYSRTLVITKTKKENTDWLEELPADVTPAVYVVDDATSPLHPPKNKGHEAMVYLTYIIDHYDDLPDIMMFMHAHQRAWHNEEPLGFDSLRMVQHVSNERVTRMGYMNMRCHWGPGCPNWMHPKNASHDIEKQEESFISKSWSEIFPFDPVPEVLSQPCCAQFAVSRQRVQTVPRSQYIHYRDWLLRTELTDYFSGRVWEYLWHYVFTGESVFCPDQRVCYCDGYGICFNGQSEFDDFQGLIFRMRDLKGELRRWRQKTQAIEKATQEGNTEELKKLGDPPEEGRDKVLEEEIQKHKTKFDNMTDMGLENGKDPQVRAREAGREWKKGDGY